MLRSGRIGADDKFVDTHANLFHRIRHTLAQLKA